MPPTFTQGSSFTRWIRHTRSHPSARFSFVRASIMVALTCLGVTGSKALGCRYALRVILKQKAHQRPINDCATLRSLLDEVVPGGRSELKIAQRFNDATEAIVGHACRLPDRKISSGALALQRTADSATTLWRINHSRRAISRDQRSRLQPAVTPVELHAVSSCRGALECSWRAPCPRER